MTERPAPKPMCRLIAATLLLSAAYIFVFLWPPLPAFSWSYLALSFTGSWLGIAGIWLLRRRA